MDDEIAIKALRYDAIVNELYRKGMDTGIGFYGQIEFIKSLSHRVIRRAKDQVPINHSKYYYDPHAYVCLNCNVSIPDTNMGVGVNTVICPHCRQDAVIPDATRVIQGLIEEKEISDAVIKRMSDILGKIAQYEGRLDRQDKSPVHNWARNGQELAISVEDIQLKKPTNYGPEQDDPFREDNYGPNEEEPYDDDPDCTRSDVGIFYK